MLCTALLAARGAGAGPGPPLPELSPVTHELPQQTVTAMALDAGGFLWVGTLSGLARWDGYTARTFVHLPGDPTSLASNLVLGLAADGTGRIWVETAAGVQPFLGVTRGFGEIHPHGSLARDGSGTLWVATPGGIFRAVAGGLHRVAPLPPEPAGARGERPRPLGDGAGGVWIPGPRGTFLRWDGTGWREVRLEVPADPALTVVGRGRLWTVCRGGVWECSEATPAWRCRERVRIGGGGGGGQVLTVARGLGETLWVGTGEGALRITLSTGAVERVPVGTPRNCPSQMVRSILVAPDGTAWLGTVTGVWCRPPYLPAFEFVGAGDGLSGGFVTALAEDGQDHLWVGLYGGAVDEILPGGRIVSHRQRTSRGGGVAFDRVWAVVPAPGGELWVGGDAGLARLDPRHDTFHRVTLPPPRSAVTALLRGTDPSVVWAGRFQGGLLRLRGPEQDPELVFPPRPPASWNDPRFTVRSLALAMGSLWIGTARGLLRLDPTTGEVVPVAGRAGTPPLAGPVVWQVRPAGGGRLWVATDGGLDLVSPAEGTVRHVLGAPEIPGATVYRMEADASGWLWLSTNHGLVRFDPRTGQHTLYGRAEGVLVEEFNRGASCRRRDGSLSFGGNRGLVVVHPDRVPVPRRLRPPLVVSLKVLTPRGWRELEPPRAGGALSVDPGGRAVQIVLARPMPAGAEQVRYRFRVSEREESWLDLGPGRSITLARTGAGTLHLEAQAAEPAGPWSESFSLAIRFLPGFWERGEVRAAGALLVALLVGLAGWGLTVRRYRHRMELARAARRLAEERDRIARDLHDEIGAGLTSISLLTELLAAAPGHGEREEQAARRIGRTARRLLQSLDSLIWAVDPRHDSMEELVASLREAAAEAIEAAGLRADLRFPEPPPQMAVSGERRRTALLVLREAVANAVRHGAATTVRVYLEVDPRGLRLEVADDGRGFDPEAVRARGHGLGNMRARARRVGGRCRIETTPGAGTRVILEFPLAGDAGGIPRTGDRAGGEEDA